MTLFFRKTFSDTDSDRRKSFLQLILPNTIKFSPQHSLPSWKSFYPLKISSHILLLFLFSLISLCWGGSHPLLQDTTSKPLGLELVDTTNTSASAYTKTSIKESLPTYLKVCTDTSLAIKSKCIDSLARVEEKAKFYDLLSQKQFPEQKENQEHTSPQDHELSLYLNSLLTSFGQSEQIKQDQRAKNQRQHRSQNQNYTSSSDVTYTREKDSPSNKSDSTSSDNEEGAGLAAAFLVGAAVVVTISAVVGGTYLLFDALYNGKEVNSQWTLGMIPAYAHNFKIDPFGEPFDESNLYALTYLNWTASRENWGVGVEARVGLHHLELLKQFDPIPIEGSDRGLFGIGPTITLGRAAPFRATLAFLPGVAVGATPGPMAMADCKWDLYSKDKWNFGAYFGSVLVGLGPFDGVAVKKLELRRDLSFALGIHGNWGW